MIDQNAFDEEYPSDRKADAGSLESVRDIAERALWNPAKVSDSDIQKLAAAVVSHLRNRRPAPPIGRSGFDETDGAQ